MIRCAQCLPWDHGLSRPASLSGHLTFRTAWSSSAGRVWERTVLSGIEDAQLNDVAAIENGAVVVGARRQEDSFPGASQGALWLCRRELEP